MLDVAVGERRDMNEPVDAREELDEGAERLQPHDLPGEALPFLELRPGRAPRLLPERPPGGGGPRPPCPSRGGGGGGASPSPPFPPPPWGGPAPGPFAPCSPPPGA